MAKQSGGAHEQHVRAGKQSHKNDPKKSSQQSAQENKKDQSEGSHRGGAGNFAEDRERASKQGAKVVRASE